MRGRTNLMMLTLVVMAAGTAAQTTVTTNGGATNTVPLFTGSATVGNSAITQSGGNVGIGTSSPEAPLTISNYLLNGLGTNESIIAAFWTGADTNLVIGGDLNGTSTPYLQSRNLGSANVIGSGNYSLALNPYGGNVGIGTTNPLYPLQFGSFVSVESGMAGSPWAGGIRFGDNSGWKFVIGRQWENISHSSNDTGSTGALLTVQDNGNFGIGTTNPGATLEVNGSMKLTANSGASITFQDGTTQSTAYTGVTCGGDFAESVDVAGKRITYEPGDVLVIDPNSPGKFLKSAEPYSTSVTGIYSTRPGTVGRRQTGPKNPDEVPMAMVGIVPTKVTAENGSIHPGDLLVTSSTLGYAMKGTDRSRMLGAVIGKALGSLDKGEGVIEVVVTLQ